MNELEEIAQKYKSGQLDYLKEELLQFLRKHREKILLYKLELETKNKKPVTLETAVKFYLLKVRSINPKRDLQEQYQEMEKEKWYIGEKLKHSPDPNEIARIWAERYSPGWRAHRVTTIIFIFEAEKDRYIAALLGKDNVQSNAQK